MPTRHKSNAMGSITVFVTRGALVDVTRASRIASAADIGSPRRRNHGPNERAEALRPFRSIIPSPRQISRFATSVLR